MHKPDIELVKDIIFGVTAVAGGCLFLIVGVALFSFVALEQARQIGQL
jgi:hypothetical protein